MLKKLVASFMLLGIACVANQVLAADHVMSDGNGGFFSPKCYYMYDGKGGYTPDGYITSDGNGGFYTP